MKKYFKYYFPITFESFENTRVPLLRKNEANIVDVTRGHINQQRMMLSLITLISKRESCHFLIESIFSLEADNSESIIILIALLDIDQT